MTAKLPELDQTNPPDCPACHRPVFRRGRMVTLMENLENRKYGHESFTVCMHCSAIRKLLFEDGAVRLVPLTEGERKDAWPALEAAVKKFDMNRAVAARYGMTIEEFMDRIDALPEHVRRALTE